MEWGTMFSSTCIRPFSKVATLGGFCGLAVGLTACMEGLISGDSSFLVVIVMVVQFVPVGGYLKLVGFVVVLLVLVLLANQMESVALVKAMVAELRSGNINRGGDGKEADSSRICH
ncbi:hypothetical protein WN943_002626 [Citrus x changshan-huyou]